MKTELHTLSGATPGVTHTLRVLRFGKSGARPKVTIQAALHADETPALLVAWALSQQLEELEAAGQLLGEVLLIPVANPLGLAQRVLGQHEGRFDLRDGINFNRGHADLGSVVAQGLAGQLDGDAAANVSRARRALVDAAQALPAATPTEHLKRRLLMTAIDSDIVLDLHCDAQAVVHLYALTPHAALAAELGALLGAQAILLAEDSGDAPFDEACSRPWIELQRRFPDHPLPAACFAPTVELRGQCDTDLHLAAHDAGRILAFLRRRGVLAGTLEPLPEAACEPTPLAGSEPVIAPFSGALVFHAQPGQRLSAGERVCTLVDIETGHSQALCSNSDGVLYARISNRWAFAGQRVAKVAGRSLQRTGKLLSA